MMEPKWVISMGVCASTGGMFNNYAIVQGVDQLVPVDVYAPGCPPSPETLMHAILTLHEQIRTGAILRRPPVAPPEPPAQDSPWTPEVAETVRLGTPT
jgi:NADH-quinone oxidoreductase subunit B